MDFEDEVKKLKIDKDNPNDSVSIDYMDGLSISKMTTESKKKKKAKPKKEKKSELTKKLDKVLGDGALEAFENDDELPLLDFADKIKNSTKKTRKGLTFDVDGFRDSDGSSRKKKKSSEKEFAAKFEPQAKLLTALLKEADRDGKICKDVLTKLVGAEVRGVSKTMTDLMAVINSNTSTRLSIVKELYNINKAASDLALKKDAQKKDKSEDIQLDSELAGASLFSNLFGTGRKNVLDAVNQASAYSPEEVERIYQQDSNSGTASSENPQLSDTNAELEKIASEYNSSHEEPYRSSDSDKLIIYESRRPRIVIKKGYENDEWEMIAVDSNDIEIEDYPLPESSDLKLTFCTETDIATDQLGRTYNVIYTI